MNPVKWWVWNDVIQKAILKTEAQVDLQTRWRVLNTYKHLTEHEMLLLVRMQMEDPR